LVRRLKLLNNNIWNILLFTERYQTDIIDTLTQLKEYFTKSGVYTENLLEYSFIGNRLYIELDIASAYDGGRSERESIKSKLKRFGFEYAGDTILRVNLSDVDLQKAKDFFNTLE
jgi:hypothetical protein